MLIFTDVNINISSELVLKRVFRSLAKSRMKEKSESLVDDIVLARITKHFVSVEDLMQRHGADIREYLDMEEEEDPVMTLSRHFSF